MQSGRHRTPHIARHEAKWNGCFAHVRREKRLADSMTRSIDQEARDELRRLDSRLIGSVAYFPEGYGEEFILFAPSILQKKPARSAVFARHQTVTQKNVGLLLWTKDVSAKQDATPSGSKTFRKAKAVTIHECSLIHWP